MQKTTLSKPMKFGWRYFQNRRPFVETIEDLIARWTADAHNELVERRAETAQRAIINLK